MIGLYFSMFYKVISVSDATCDDVVLVLAPFQFFRFISDQEKNDRFQIKSKRFDAKKLEQSFVDSTFSKKKKTFHSYKPRYIDLRCSLHRVFYTHRCKNLCLILFRSKDLITFCTYVLVYLHFAIHFTKFYFIIIKQS